MATPSPAADSHQSFKPFNTLIDKLYAIREAHLRDMASKPAIDRNKATLTPDEAFDLLYPTALNLIILRLQETKERIHSEGHQDPEVWESAPRVNKESFQERIELLRTIATHYSKIRTAPPLGDEAKMYVIETAYLNSLEELLLTLLRNQDMGFILEEFSFWANNIRLLELLRIPPATDILLRNKPCYYSVIFDQKRIQSILGVLQELADSDDCLFDASKTFEDAQLIIDRLTIIDECLKALPDKKDNFPAFFMLLNLYRTVLINIGESAWLQEDTPQNKDCLKRLKNTWETIRRLVEIETLENYPLLASQFDAISDSYSLVIEKACLPDTKRFISKKPSAQRSILRESSVAEEELSIPPTYALAGPHSPGLNMARFADAHAFEASLRKNISSLEAITDRLNKLGGPSELTLQDIYGIGDECDNFVAAMQSFASGVNLLPMNFQRIFTNHVQQGSLYSLYELMKTARQFISDETFFEESNSVFALHEAQLFQRAFKEVSQIIPKGICSVEVTEEGMVFSIDSNEKKYLVAATKAIGRLAGFRSDLREKTITLPFSEATRPSLEAFLNALKTNLQNAHSNLMAEQASTVNMPAISAISPEEKEKLQAQYEQEEAAQKALEAKRKAQAGALEDRQTFTISSTTTARTSSEEEKITPSIPFADILTVEALLQANLSNQLKDILNNSKVYPAGTPAYHVQNGKLHMYVVPSADALREMTEAERMILAEKRETGREFTLGKFVDEGWLFRIKVSADRRLTGHYCPKTHTVTLEAGDAVVVTLDKQWDHDRRLRSL